MPAEETKLERVKWYIDSSVSFLTRKGIDSPQLVVEYLVCRILRCKRLELPLYYTKQATPRFCEVLKRGVMRAGTGEPIQYILGEWDFRELTLKVDKRALIPRPETEGLVQLLLDDMKHCTDPSPVILDYGTGTGCIALSIAKELPNSRVIALDVSEDALSLARENATKLGLDSKVVFVNCSTVDLADILEPNTINAIISNPPYIPSASCDALDSKVKDFEPRLALDGGPDGMDIARAIIEEAAMLLTGGGSLYMELSAEDNQPELLRSYMESLSFEDVRVLPDVFKANRFLAGRLPIGL
ncbi:MAG: peptide chain release factor N(5)-glutamine methyltransferase [Kiritimatiellae bacterium]|jgi:release factor glutamine methyltransferase|nr:peptide chain release factor N(5)-glutamine methyltransferase [Kiritimatiellia bacterium]